MAALEQFDNDAWDRFFEFITPDVALMTSDEVDDALRLAGVDTSAAFDRVLRALNSRQARADLARAQRDRPALLEKITSRVIGPVNDARERLRQAISTRVPAAARPVLFRKLDKAATDHDIQSLFEDIHRLEHLESERDDGST